MDDIKFKLLWRREAAQKKRGRRGNLISPAKLWKSSHFIVFATYKFYIPPFLTPTATASDIEPRNAKKNEYKTVQLHIMRVRTLPRDPLPTPPPRPFVSLLKTENGTPRKMRPSHS